MISKSSHYPVFQIFPVFLEMLRRLFALSLPYREVFIQYTAEMLLQSVPLSLRLLVNISVEVNSSSSKFFTQKILQSTRQ